MVDDNATNRRILEQMLANRQMEATAVEGGASALRALTDAFAGGRPFQLVLLDVMMPEMDGFTVAEQIRRDPASAPCPVLMLSSAGRPGDAALCQGLGLAAYLTKPVKQSELLDAIVNAVSRAPAAPLPAGPAGESAPSVRALRILVAEDNPVNQQVVSRMLERRGHSVVMVSTGQEALDAAERSRYDVILMDVQMPEMNGLEAATRLREREARGGPRVPILAMTAHAMQETGSAA